MKRYFLAVPLLLCGIHARADAPAAAAVAATNYQAGLNSGDTYISGNRATYFYDINGSITFPLATYLGATFSGNYDHTSITSNPFPDTTPPRAWPSCAVHSKNFEAGLFARNSSFGRIGVDYGAGRQESHCNATFVDTGGDTLNTRHSTASAEYYFSRVTFAVARSKLHIESGNDLDSETLGASWYPINATRITLAADGLDFKDTYHLDMEYQPEFLDNSMSFLFGYTTQRQTLTTHSISVGFRYFFDTNANLLTRDRHYR
jgi:hypothetical protein